MAQFALPIADLLTDAGWTATPYWSKIDADDANVIQNGTPTTTEIIAVDLGSVTDPAVSTDHNLRANFQKVTGSGTLRLTVQLRQGYVNEGSQGTLIATGLFDEGDIGVFETYTLTLSGAEADSITDYADLQLRVWASRDTGAGGRPIDVNFAWFEVPDTAPTGETVAIAASLQPLGMASTVEPQSDLSFAGSLSTLDLSASTDSASDASIAASLPAFALAAQLDVPAVDVQVAADLPALTLGAQADAAADVSVAGALPALGLAASTDSASDVSVAGSLPGLTLAANLSDRAQMSFAGSLQPLDLAAALDAAAAVAIAGGLPSLGLSASITVNITTVTFNASLPGLTLAAQTDAAGIVTVAGTLPALGLSATLVVGIPVVIEIEIGPLQTLWGAGISTQNDPAGVTVAQRWNAGGPNQGWRTGGLTK